MSPIPLTMLLPCSAIADDRSGQKSVPLHKFLVPWAPTQIPFRSGGTQPVDAISYPKRPIIAWIGADPARIESNKRYASMAPTFTCVHHGLTHSCHTECLRRHAPREGHLSSADSRRNEPGIILGSNSNSRTLPSNSASQDP